MSECCIEIDVPTVSTGSYTSSVVTDIASTTVEVVDSVSPIMVTAIGPCMPAWDINTEYEEDDVVSYNGKFYKLIVAANSGSVPEDDDGNSWEEVDDPCTETKDVTVNIPTYALETQKKTVNGTVSAINVPPCNVPILVEKPDETRSFTVQSLSSTGSHTIYEYELSGYSAVSISGASASIPSCSFDVLRFYTDAQRSIHVPSFSISSSSTSVELDISIPSCEIDQYSYELNAYPYNIVCTYPVYSLSTENKFISYSAAVVIPVYETIPEVKNFTYSVPQFVNKYIDKVRCSTIPVPIYSTSSHEIDFECSTNLYSLNAVPDNQQITIPHYSNICHVVELKSYNDAYYVPASRKSRALVPCAPGGYENQPPTPTWTNTGKAKMYLEVTLRKGVAEKYEREKKAPLPDGWGIDDPECDLVIYIRDYETGEVLEELDNSIEWWAWVTAKDAENTFNDKFEPFGNKVRKDKRWEDETPVELIQAAIRIERHHQVENPLFVDTPLTSGHLQYAQLSSTFPSESIENGYA